MIQFKDIHIPKPCSVEYDSLSGNDIKRFCDSCEKNVYDFRGKDEIYFNSIIHTQGKVCGIFYEDQINKPSLKIQRSFPYALATKIIGFVLFIKTLLSPHDMEAAIINTHKIEMQATDSTTIKVITKNNHNKRRHPYTIDIFINKKLFKSNVIETSNYIYLPDSIKENDEIKIKVKRDHSGANWTNEIVKTKTYHFKYKEAENITINIVYKQPIRLMRRRYIVGEMGNFW